MPEPLLPDDIETYRDKWWRREPDNRVEDVQAAEHFINSVGFCSGLTDARRPGPSLFIAVCGRRDAHLPRNVQKDPESSLTWVLKDQLMSRGRVFYGKLARGRAIFVSRRLIPHFNSLWGDSSRERNAVAITRCQIGVEGYATRVGDGHA